MLFLWNKESIFLALSTVVYYNEFVNLGAERNGEKPIVIYDAFSLFDEGKNVSELYECMLKTNRPILVHVPEGTI